MFSVVRMMNKSFFNYLLDLNLYKFILFLSLNIILSFSALAVGVPSAPSSPSASVNGDNISVYWSSSDNATYYDLSIKYNTNNWTSPGIYTFTGTSTSWSGLGQGTRSYKVRACNSTGCSGYSGSSAGVVIYPELTVPVNFNATVEDKNITVTWDAVQGAEKYDVLIKYNDNDWTTPGRYITQDNSISWNNLPSGTRSYKVRSCDTNLVNCSVWSEASNAVSISVWPTAVVNGKDIEVTWGGVQGAEKYDVLIKYNDNDWTTPGRYITQNNSISWNNLPSGTRSYKVRSCDTNLVNCSIYSEASNAVSISAWPTAVVNGKDIEVTWGGVQGAEKYDVLIKYNDNDWTTPGRYITQDNSISWNNLPSGTRSYKVRSCDINLINCSVWSEPSNFVVISSPEVYRDNIGSLFLKLTQPHGYQYLKLSKSLDNNWTIIELEESQWNSLGLILESFSIEIADFNFDNLPDFRLVSANKNIVITGLKTNAGYQVNQEIKINIISTDLIGTPTVNHVSGVN